MKFSFSFELKDGYTPINPLVDTYEEKEISIVVEARNYATASRMIKALLAGSTNIAESYGGVCIDE